MKKLIKGILDFKSKTKSQYSELFTELAKGQKPDALFIACSDSRVVPNLFASTNPGDLFVVRNVGNLIPICDSHLKPGSDQHCSEAAALEFSLEHLQVKDIIVCGHSECGAMNALIAGREKLAQPNLRTWLKHGESSLEHWKRSELSLDPNLSEVNQLSQINVLVQAQQIQSYPGVAKRVEAGELQVHAWWFDISEATVQVFNPDEKLFKPIDEQEAKRLGVEL